MSVRLATFGVLAVALAGCGADRTAGLAPACVTDAQCGPGQLCFAEGCGDPGENIVVEVVGGSLTGHYARDFAIANGTLGPTRDFDLGAPLSLGGEFQRERTAVVNPTNRTVYSDAVTVRAVGESSLIPGVRRTYETTFDAPERGRFQLSVGAGEFEITASPVDPSVPPIVISDVAVQPGLTPPSLTFAFPAVDGAPIVAGQLVKALRSAVVPNDPVLLTVGNIEVQLVDPETRRPLSQRFPVGATSGEFSITANPEVKSQASMMLVASPREPGVPVPTKSFMLTNPLPLASILEYGDFGEAKEVRGRVVDLRGQPVAGAQVYLEGVVGGDGTFRSLIVETDLTGAFKVSSLASRMTGSFTLTVSPPMNTASAYTRRAATVTIVDGEGVLEPDVITLDDSLLVSGQVLDPDGKPAAGVGVRATVHEPGVSQAESRLLPIEPGEAVTDELGHFTLSLDPGVWRFEYFPGGALPLASRLVTVRASTSDGGLPSSELTLPAVNLANGRKVTGTITGNMGTRMGAAVQYSQLRFFRVAPVEGRPSAILLGTAVADERGRYQVVLPDAARDRK